MRLLEVLGALIVAIALAVGTYNVLMFILRKVPKEAPTCDDQPNKTTTTTTTKTEEGA